MKKFKGFFQHHLNPLHVYCRLCGAGLRPMVAHKMCRVYEKFLYNMLLK
ncbi:MAG: hypothetical protein R6X11_00870 [Desulfonatronovibrio sp.]